MTQRKAHVVRVYQDGDTGSGKWVDVLRIERWPAIQNGGGQVKFYGFTKWQDDSGDGDGKSANKVHKTEQVTVKSGTGSTICDVPATKAMVLKNSGQEVIYHFRNDKDSNDARHVKLIRVHPVSLPDVHPTVPVDWEDVYKPALQAGDPDTDKWITMAVPITWQSKQQQGATYQGQGHKLKNKAELVDILNNFEETDDDTDAVWLDPFSVIVNWAGHDTDENAKGLLVNYAWGISGSSLHVFMSRLYATEWFTDVGGSFGTPGGRVANPATGDWIVSMAGAPDDIPLTPPVGSHASITGGDRVGDSRFEVFIEFTDDVTGNVTGVTSVFVDFAGTELSIADPNDRAGSFPVSQWQAGTYDFDRVNGFTNPGGGIAVLYYPIPLAGSA